MNIEQVGLLLEELSEFHTVPAVRVSFDYNDQLAHFLRERNYSLCVEDDAFGIQIVVSDANYTRVVAKKDASD